MKLRCRWLPTGDFEFTTNPKSKAYLGVDDININHSENQQKMAEVKRHIRHKHTYKGGGSYGHFGGHDITMIELEQSFPELQAACLPSPAYDDIRLNQKDSMLAGYGRFFRESGKTCQTNRFGEMKYHYCDKNYGEGNTACTKDEPPPMSNECEKFFNHPET